jgi:hypothetical protein
VIPREGRRFRVTWGAAVRWLLPLLVIVALWPLLWSPPRHLGDYFTFWYAGRLLASGSSPYDPAAWASAPDFSNDPTAVVINALGRQAALGIPVWLYPPWTGYLFVPFGALPVAVGAGALHLAFLGLAVLGAFAVAALVPWRSPVVAGLAVSVMLATAPFVLAVRGGQFMGLLLVGLALVGHGLRDRSRAAFVAGAIVLALKPHVFLVVAVVALVILIRRRDLTTLATTTATIALLVVAGVILQPASVGVLARGSGQSLSALLDYASVWAFASGLARNLMPLAGIALVAAIGASCALAAGAASAAHRFVVGGAAACVASLALPPYLGSYDHALALAPATFAAAFAAERSAGPQRTVGVAAVLLIAGVVPWLAWAEAQIAGEWVTGIVPIVCAGLVVLSARDPQPHAVGPASEAAVDAAG